MPHTKNAPNRLVDYKTTESIINKIRDRMDYLTKSENSRHNNNLPTWKWFRLGLLVSENIQDDGLTVHDNYKLLRPNHIISYDQALFLLLGLNALTFDKHPIWYGFTLHKKDLHMNDIDYLERVFYDTPQNIELKHSDRLVDGKIQSEDLIILAKDNDFFTHEGLSYINTLFSKKKYKDPDTKIPINRLKIYKETLPEYLETLSAPISLRSLSMKSDELSEGDYTSQIKDSLGVGGPTVRKELSELIKTQWWLSLPKNIKDKIKNSHH